MICWKKSLLLRYYYILLDSKIKQEKWQCPYNNFIKPFWILHITHRKFELEQSDVRKITLNFSYFSVVQIHIFIYIGIRITITSTQLMFLRKAYFWQKRIDYQWCIKSSSKCAFFSKQHKKFTIPVSNSLQCFSNQVLQVIKHKRPSKMISFACFL